MSAWEFLAEDVQVARIHLLARVSIGSSRKTQGELPMSVKRLISSGARPSIREREISILTLSTSFGRKLIAEALHVLVGQ